MRRTQRPPRCSDAIASVDSEPRRAPPKSARRAASRTTRGDRPAPRPRSGGRPNAAGTQPPVGVVRVAGLLVAARGATSGQDPRVRIGRVCATELSEAGGDRRVHPHRRPQDGRHHSPGKRSAHADAPVVGGGGVRRGHAPDDRGDRGRAAGGPPGEPGAVGSVQRSHPERPRRNGSRSRPARRTVFGGRVDAQRATTGAGRSVPASGTPALGHRQAAGGSCAAHVLPYGATGG